MEIVQAEEVSIYTCAFESRAEACQSSGEVHAQHAGTSCADR